MNHGPEKKIPAPGTYLPVSQKTAGMIIDNAGCFIFLSLTAEDARHPVCSGIT